MTDAEGGAPVAAGKAERAADVPGTPVPESGAEAVSGRKGPDPEVSAGAVGWGLEAEEGRAEVLAEFWGEEAPGGARDGGEAPAAADGGDAAGPAREPGADGPGREEAALPAEAAGRPADAVAGARGRDARAAVPDVAAEAEEGGDAGVGAGEPESVQAEAPGPAAGRVLAAVEALRFELSAVEEAVSGLPTKLGEVSTELGEIKGKLDAVVEAPAKEADGSRETVKEGLGKIEAMISGLSDSLIAQSELLKQAGQGQGEKGENNFQSQLRELMEAGLERVGEQISGLMDWGNKQSEAFEGVKLDVKVVKEVGASVGSLDERLQAYKKDLSRDRELLGGPRKWAVLAVSVVAAPALVLAGAFVEGQWEVLPLEESTGGWKDHVWERYGLDLVECVKTGVRQGGPYDCTVDVGASVDQVRRASGR